MKPANVKLDEAKLRELCDAQLRHVVELINEGHYITSDDGYDYLSSALSLGELLLTASYDGDVERIEGMLNSSEGEDGWPHNSMAQYACDGVCAAIYEMNPPSLHMED